jgi:hypothetical protein
LDGDIFGSDLEYESKLVSADSLNNPLKNKMLTEDSRQNSQPIDKISFCNSILFTICTWQSLVQLNKRFANICEHVFFLLLAVQI